MTEQNYLIHGGQEAEHKGRVPARATLSKGTYPGTQLLIMHSAIEWALMGQMVPQESLNPLKLTSLTTTLYILLTWYPVTS